MLIWWLVTGNSGILILKKIKSRTTLLLHPANTLFSLITPSLLPHQTFSWKKETNTLFSFTETTHTKGGASFPFCSLPTFLCPYPPSLLKSFRYVYRWRGPPHCAIGSWPDQSYIAPSHNPSSIHFIFLVLFFFNLDLLLMLFWEIELVAYHWEITAKGNFCRNFSVSQPQVFVVFKSFFFPSTFNYCFVFVFSLKLKTSFL